MTLQQYLNFVNEIVQQIRGLVQVKEWKDFDDTDLSKCFGVSLVLTKHNFTATIRLTLSPQDCEREKILFYRDQLINSFNQTLDA